MATEVRSAEAAMLVRRGIRLVIPASLSKNAPFTPAPGRPHLPRQLEATLVERIGFRLTALCFVNTSQIVEGLGDVRMTRGQRLLADSQYALERGLGLLEASLHRIECRQIVESLRDVRMPSRQC